MAEIPITDERMYEGGSDMVTRMLKSPAHRDAAQYFTDNEWSRFGEQLRAHDSPAIVYPNHVVTNPIKLSNGIVDLEWGYQTKESPKCVHLRRVFVRKDQVVQLDLEQTLSWLSAGKGSPQHDAVKAQLDAEVADVTNQAIMQLMTDRLDNGESMLPGKPYTPFG
ncbi:hypothetical protein HY485_05115 [Candidatus Woesearchaeota archaeon]|nr:hypothetical protein [Candidatus Woesearchaeota archaeon]